jgi:hypothetical protein
MLEQTDEMRNRPRVACLAERGGSIHGNVVIIATQGTQQG